MNSLIRLGKVSKFQELSTLFVRKGIFAVTPKFYSDIIVNRDWRPGPYPKTEAERIAAAKKYGLHPKDYKPYPDDGTGHGDYPMLEILSDESRDPFQYHNNAHNTRNYGEPLHVDEDIYTKDLLDESQVYRVTPNESLLYFSIFFFSFGLVMFVDKKYFAYDTPIMPPQKPYSGVKHYTFESLD